jgi:hypothetical protein
VSADDTHYVYVIATVKDGRHCAPVKVGITKHLDKRVSALQTASPYQLRMIHAIGVPCRAIALEMEDCFHATHKAEGLKGEWFDMPPHEALAILTFQFRLHLDINGVEPETIEAALELSGANRASEVIARLRAEAECQ